jgi:hypothetical protein
VAGDEFADSAGVWLIAQAEVHGQTVVTHERPSNEQGRIKIPVAAAEVGARVMDPYAMLRHERVRFIREVSA